VDTDEKISAILRDDAPPRHDPTFRLRVLERIERKRFQHGIAKLFAAATVVVVALWIGAGVRTVAHRFDVLLLCVVLALSFVAHGPVLTHFARKVWSRSGQQRRS
jgi:hypothetical protein